MRQNLISRIFFSKISLILGIALLILASVVFYNVLTQKRSIDREIDSLKQEISELESDNLELEKFLDYTNSSSYIERTAKQKLNVKHEGEKVVVIGDGRAVSNELKGAGGNVIVSETLTSSNIYNWWTYFFGEGSGELR